LYSNQLTVAVSVITKVVAIPIEIADESLFETPMNGQIPRKYERTKLFTKAAEMKIINNSIFKLLLLSKHHL
jgi:hypothetical protein